MKCKLHGGMEATVYCKDCKTMICQACITAHSKQKHELEFIADMIHLKADTLCVLIKENEVSISKAGEEFLQELPRIKAGLLTLKARLQSLSLNIESLLGLIGEDPKQIRASNLIEQITTIKTRLKNAPDKYRESELDELEKQVLFLLNWGDAFAPIKAEFESLVKTLESTSVLPTLANAARILSGSEDAKWYLDPYTKHPDLVLSNRNLTVERVMSSYQGTSVVGTKGFSKGVHKWEVRMDDLLWGKGGRTNWACFGVIEKVSFNVKEEDYKGAYGISTYGQLYNVNGITSYITVGQTCNVTLNCDEGTLWIRGEGIDVKAKGLKGLTLYPYFCLYNASNKLTVLL